MKKVYLLLLSVFFLTRFAAHSQCTNTTSFGTVTINPAGGIATISTCSFAGEFSTINGAVAGQALTFTSSIATDFITIHSGTSNGPVVASGLTPLSFSNSFTGTLFAHWNTSAACGTASACRTTTVQCTNCVLPPPANDLCAGAININCAQTITGTTAAASSDAVANCVTALSTAPGVWYTFTGDGQVSTLSLCGSSFDTKIGIFSGTCAALTCITGNDDFAGCGLQSQASVVTVVGTQYYVLVTGFGTNSGSFTLTRTCSSATPNDNCSGAININCAQTITGNTATATVDAVATCGTTLNTAPGLWYTFTGNGANITLSLCGSSFDTKIGVFSGSCAALTCVTGNDDFAACGGNGFQSQVTFPSVFGTQYYVLVTGFGTASGSFTLARTCVFPNELCAGAINIDCGQTINATTAGAAVDAVGTCGTSLGTAPGLWYAFTGDGSPVTLATCGGITAYDTKLGVFSGTCTSLVCVAGNDDFCGSRSQVTFPTVFGTQYYILVTGFSTGSGNFSLTRTCVAACAGTPLAGTITGPATTCSGGAATLTLNGFTPLPGIGVQWKSSTVSGGPYTNIAGAISSTYSFIGTGTTTYYIATVTCANGGAAVNSPQFTVVQGAPAHSVLSFTVTSVCSPGTATFTGTAVNGGPGNYTHVLTGPGTITPNAPTGTNNNTGNFVVSNVPFGTNTFTLTTTDGIGCSVASAISGVIVNQTPVITLTPAAATICNGQIQQISASVVPPGVQTFAQASTIVIPAGSPALSAGIAGPYPSLINIAGLPATGVTVKSVRLGNVNHTFPDDMDIVLVSPAGQAVVLMSDVGGGTDEVGLDYTFDDAGVPMADAALNPSGTYKPTNFGATDTYPAPGPGSLTQASPTLSSFSGNPNGDWKLYIVDAFTGDVGFIANWNITFTITSLVSFSPTTNLFTDALATVPYTGTQTSVVFAKPTVTTPYVATSTVAGCTSTATSTITVNQSPAITTQPTPAAQTVCPGTTVTYSVAATGAGLTYQWRLGATNLVNNAQISGATTNTLTITNVAAANAGSYTVLVSGTCTPAVTSTAAVLTVASAPVISAQPASVTICAGANASFTVANAGSVPAPTIYQWQVSTDGGTTWTNLLTPDAFTPAITITGATIAQNATRYRVIVTNTCAQATTSSAAILTVNPLPAVTAGALPVRICISDSLVALTGSPVGGSWSGIGVSGFNFVPPATAVGSYTLTYRFTNTLGCASTATVVAVVQECPERSRLLANDALVVYPNPNSGRFFVRVNSTLYNYIGMKVYNAQGQLLNGKSVNDALVSPVFGGLVFGRVIPINLTHLPAGIYMVKFYYDGGVGTAEKGFKVVIGGH